LAQRPQLYWQRRAIVASRAGPLATMEAAAMHRALPTWAIQTATVEDYDDVRAALPAGKAQVTWPERASLRAWGRHQGWALPRFGFEGAFIRTMLADAELFARAINDSGLVIRLPRQGHTLSTEQLAELDRLYAASAPGDRARHWDMLVEELRAIRRAVEAGVVVTVPGTPPLRDRQGFYEGADHWIGDDAS
jgi:hypothetical protein